MKRFRLSTLMLLIVIAALAIALTVQQIRSGRREAEAQARIAQLQLQLAVKDLERLYVQQSLNAEIQPSPGSPLPAANISSTRGAGEARP